MLPRKFYLRDSSEVAKDLLGKVLTRDGIKGRIVETEAYYGEGDPASHACNGRTERNEPMFGEAGRTYIYLCYGIYYLLNVTTEEEGSPGAVLIRALEPREGVGKMRENRGVEEKEELTNGPGKLTQALNITKEYNDQDVTKSSSDIRICEGEEVEEMGSSKRTGVSEHHNKELRFFDKNSEYISG
ncbi:MAG: DNA-3-methyladenine glycosylase [Candidatus Aenigmatarchaeota archaeon]